MMEFKRWINENKIFTGISNDAINHWSNYASSRIFASEQEARNWLFAKMEHGDKTSPPGFFYGTEYNKAFSDAFPVYQSGKSFKLGKRIRKDNRFRAKSLEVKRTDLYELNVIAQANGTGDYDFLPVKWIRISFTENDYYLRNSQELARIKNLAYQIKSNGWIETIVYDASDLSIIEGQHRSRAMFLMGFKTVPGIGIKYSS